MLKTEPEKPFGALEIREIKDSEISGILPLFRFKPLVSASWFVSVLFFDTAGILARRFPPGIFFFKTVRGL